MLTHAGHAMVGYSGNVYKTVHLARNRFTVNPRRRIKQHNGVITQGAWKTSKWRPWEMVLVVFGFTTQVQALQFEWAWQHPLKSKAVRALANELGYNRMQGVRGKMSLMLGMLSLPPWKFFPLTIQYTASVHHQLALRLQPPPAHVKVAVAPLEDLPACLADDEDGRELGTDSGNCVALTAAVAGDAVRSTASRGRGKVEKSGGRCRGKGRQGGDTDAQLQSDVVDQKVPTSDEEKAGADYENGSGSDIEARQPQGARQGSQGVDAIVCGARMSASDSCGSEGSEDVCAGSEEDSAEGPTLGQKLPLDGSKYWSCDLCEQRIDRDVVRCGLERGGCGRAFHLQCIAADFSMQAQDDPHMTPCTSRGEAAQASHTSLPSHSTKCDLTQRSRPGLAVPDRGRCPACQREHNWLDLLSSMLPYGYPTKPRSRRHKNRKPVPADPAAKAAAAAARKRGSGSGGAGIISSVKETAGSAATAAMTGDPAAKGAGAGAGAGAASGTANMKDGHLPPKPPRKRAPKAVAVITAATAAAGTVGLVPQSNLTFPTGAGTGSTGGGAVGVMWLPHSLPPSEVSQGEGSPHRGAPPKRPRKAPSALQRTGAAPATDADAGAAAARGWGHGAYMGGAGSAMTAQGGHGQLQAWGHSDPGTAPEPGSPRVLSLAERLALRKLAQAQAEVEAGATGLSQHVVTASATHNNSSSSNSQPAGAEASPSAESPDLMEMAIGVRWGAPPGAQVFQGSAAAPVQCVDLMSDSGSGSEYDRDGQVATGDGGYVSGSQGGHVSLGHWGYGDGGDADGGSVGGGDSVSCDHDQDLGLDETVLPSHVRQRPGRAPWTSPLASAGNHCRSPSTDTTPSCILPLDAPSPTVLALMHPLHLPPTLLPSPVILSTSPPSPASGCSLEPSPHPGAAAAPVTICMVSPLAASDASPGAPSLLGGTLGGGRPMSAGLVVVDLTQDPSPLPSTKQPVAGKEADMVGACLGPDATPDGRVGGSMEGGDCDCWCSRGGSEGGEQKEGCVGNEGGNQGPGHIQGCCPAVRGVLLGGRRGVAMGASERSLDRDAGCEVAEWCTAVCGNDLKAMLSSPPPLVARRRGHVSVAPARAGQQQQGRQGVVIVIDSDEEGGGGD